MPQQWVIVDIYLFFISTHFVCAKIGTFGTILLVAEYNAFWPYVWPLLWESYFRPEFSAMKKQLLPKSGPPPKNKTLPPFGFSGTDQKKDPGSHWEGRGREVGQVQATARCCIRVPGWGGLHHGRGKRWGAERLGFHRPHSPGGGRGGWRRGSGVRCRAPVRGWVAGRLPLRHAVVGLRRGGGVGHRATLLGGAGGKGHPPPTRLKWTTFGEEGLGMPWSAGAGKCSMLPMRAPCCLGVGKKMGQTFLRSAWGTRHQSAICLHPVAFGHGPHPSGGSRIWVPW